MEMSYTHADRAKEIEDARTEYHELLVPYKRPATTPFPEENEEQYRKRALPIVQSVIPGYKDLDTQNIWGENFKYVERQIQEAARQEALGPTNIPDGELREVQRRDQTEEYSWNSKESRVRGLTNSVLAKRD
jgi:hypothetical protein